MAFILISFSIFILTSSLYLVSFWISISERSIEKLSPYECGLEPIGNARMKFDILYYVIGILYLIFDLEIIFLFPLASILYSLNSLIALWSAMAFLIILTLGFLYEWFMGSLVITNPVIRYYNTKTIKADKKDYTDGVIRALRDSIYAGNRREAEKHKHKKPGELTMKIQDEVVKLEETLNPIKPLHPFHMPDPSPWPFFMSIAILGFAITLVSFLKHLPILFIPSIITIAYIAIVWWRDVIREGLAGFHTKRVQNGINIGFLLFLLSEIMLFASFFWAFFHSSLAPATEISGTWPPVGVSAVNTWAIPLLGSCVLLASGFVLTLGHHAIVAGSKYLALVNFLFTVLLGFLFIFLQFNEYTFGEFTISDGAYGSVFYCTTGLHAIHVIVGVIFLAVGLIRIYKDQITTEHHLGVEFSIYYWHLVDIVWLMVFAIYYFWGSLKTIFKLYVM